MIGVWHAQKVVLRFSPWLWRTDNPTQRDVMNNNASRHKQLLITWGGQETEVDEELAPLILGLWKRGIVTVNSCQENQPGIAWIEFLTAEDAAAFLDLVARYEEGVDTLYNRINHRWDWTDENKPLSAPFWKYDVHPIDAGIVEELTDEGTMSEEHMGVNKFYFSVSIRFPRTDLPRILERVIRGQRKGRRKRRPSK